MAKFIRKQGVVEAVQWHKGVPDSSVPGVQHQPELTNEYAPRYVVTIQGQPVFLTDGDWVVKESDGVHYYPVKDAEFKKLYDPAPEESAA